MHINSLSYNNFFKIADFAILGPPPSNFYHVKLIFVTKKSIIYLKFLPAQLLKQHHSFIGVYFIFKNQRDLRKKFLKREVNDKRQSKINYLVHHHTCFDQLDFQKQEDLH